MLVFSPENTKIMLEARGISRSTPTVTSRGEWRLRSWRATSHHIGVFKSFKTNSATIKRIYDESANVIEGCNVAFDTNDCWNIP